MSTAQPETQLNVVPVTAEGYRLLREQLNMLETAGRAELSARLRAARADGGDPIENPELMFAFQAQQNLERRIAELESRLARAQVLDGWRADGQAALGSEVRVRRVGSRARPVNYEIVSSIEADPRNGRLSVESPVGEALLGRRAGETVEVATPGGVVRLEVLTVGGAGSRRKGNGRRANPARDALAA